MGKVIWSPSALEDVNSIAEFISRDSVGQAALFVARLLEATYRLQAKAEGERPKEKSFPSALSLSFLQPLFFRVGILGLFFITAYQ